MSDLSLAAKGRWLSLLPSLGVDASHLSGRHGPCPVCNGKDRFRFDDREGKGTFYCNQCGAGDGFKLLMLVRGWTFPEAAREVEKLVGSAPATAIKDREDPRVVMDRMRGIWKGAAILHQVEPARLWWSQRVGVLPQCGDIRGVDELYHAPSKRRFPGMVALVRDSQGNVCNMHRTYLTAAGSKAPVDPNRMLMPLELPKGSAVRLSDHEGRLGIAEGLETAQAVTLLTGMPCWAALNAQNLEGWLPPPDVEVTVFGDHDESYTGQAVAYRLARRLYATGVKVRVEIPSSMGEDWADVKRALDECKQSA